MTEVRLDRGQELAPSEHGEVEHVHTEHEHPGQGQYWVIALILAAVTAVEVALFYIENLDEAVLTTTLIVLSLGKFLLVILYFMHLKFDNRLFSVLFAGGLITTIGAFIAVLAMQRALF